MKLPIGERAAMHDPSADQRFASKNQPLHEVLRCELRDRRLESFEQVLHRFVENVTATATFDRTYLELEPLRNLRSDLISHARDDSVVNAPERRKFRRDLQVRRIEREMFAVIEMGAVLRQQLGIR